LHAKNYSISISKLNLIGLFSKERGKKDLERDVAKETKRTRFSIEI